MTNTEFSALLPVIIIAAIVLVAAIWLLLRANREGWQERFEQALVKLSGDGGYYRVRYGVA